MSKSLRPTKSTKTLPVELVGEILSYLPTDTKKSARLLSISKQPMITQPIIDTISQAESKKRTSAIKKVLTTSPTRRSFDEDTYRKETLEALRRRSASSIRTDLAEHQRALNNELRKDVLNTEAVFAHLQGGADPSRTAEGRRWIVLSMRHEPLLFNLFLDRIGDLDLDTYNLDDYTQSTLLNRAVLNKYEGSVRNLLEHGADPNAADREGRFPLETALGTRSSTIVSDLLRYGADATRLDKYGNTVLYTLMYPLLSYGGYKSIDFIKQVLPLLLEAGADVNKVGKNVVFTERFPYTRDIKETVLDMLYRGVSKNSSSFHGNLLESVKEVEEILRRYGGKTYRELKK